MNEIAALDARAYTVDTDQPEADGTLQWMATTVVVVRATAAGVTGIGWSYASKAAQTLVESELAGAVVGSDPLDVPGIHEKMVRAIRNLGRPGQVASAISAVDIALWDLKARLLGVSLSGLLGRCRPGAPLYGSGGFTTYDDATTTRQLEHWVGGLGIPRVKIKIGESWGSCEDRDLARVALARKVIGDTAELFVDANGGYSAKQAINVGRRLAGEHDVVWLEEPVSSDDLAGLRRVRDALPLDVAAGEYGYDEVYFARMVSAGAVDCLQIDVTRCGGYTTWMRAAALAGAHGLQVSGHCAPNLHVHVGVAVPNLRHVEYFHDHTRLDALLFDGLLTPVSGDLVPDPRRPGHGMTLRDGQAERFRVA